MLLGGGGAEDACPSTHECSFSKGNGRASAVRERGDDSSSSICECSWSVRCSSSEIASVVSQGALVFRVPAEGNKKECICGGGADFYS